MWVQDQRNGKLWNLDHFLSVTLVPSHQPDGEAVILGEVAEGRYDEVRGRVLHDHEVLTSGPLEQMQADMARIVANLDREGHPLMVLPPIPTERGV